MKIVIEILLDPAQISIEQAEKLRNNTEFYAEGSIFDFYTSSRSKQLPDYEISSKVELD